MMRILFVFIAMWCCGKVFAVSYDTLHTRLFPAQRWAQVQHATVKKLRIDTLDKMADLPLTELKQIEALSLGWHDMADVPETLCELTTLRQLDLSHNRLVTLPACISRLTALEELWLGYNPQLDLGKVIDVLALLPNLKALHLEADSIETVPPAIARLHSLQLLDLSGNTFTQLPVEFGQLAQLNTLWLDNEAAGFDLGANMAALRPLQNLRELHIEGDHLSQLPPGLMQLPSLERVYASNNPILRMPPRRELRHSHLRLLDLHNAPLPPAEIQRVQQTAPGLRIRF
jgi:internalin A